jgi:hypothetical protein
MAAQDLLFETGQPARFAAAMQGPPALAPRRLEIDPEQLKSGLGQLVLTLVKLLHELLEKQAIRRFEGGGLSDAEVERLGLTLMRQAEEIERLRVAFNLEPEDLNLDLGPLGRLL